MEINKKYLILDNESEEDYEIRICGYHETDKLTWEQIAYIINHETERDYSESRYRKIWKAYTIGRDSQIEEQISPEFDELFQAKLNAQKERVKLSDERTQINAYIRQLAREETIKEIAIATAKEMNSKKMLVPVDFVKTYSGENEAILQISDWHYGMCIDNYWNVYSPEITKKRVSSLIEQVIEKCDKNNVRVLHVVNLGDLISGRIHLKLRLESRYDVITQTMHVSEMLSEMLVRLAEKYEVHFYNCLDNHSRLEPEKKDALPSESMARLIPWYLQVRLGDLVFIHDNKYDDEIIDFKTKKYEVIGVHGDKDKPSNIVSNLSMVTHRHYDLVLAAHLHHFSANEANETILLSNGSLMGVDTFAKDLRLTSKPSQTLTIVTDKSVIDTIYRIIL